MSGLESALWGTVGDDWVAGSPGGLLQVKEKGER